MNTLYNYYLKLRIRREMENNEVSVEFITNKKYFIEDAINISFKLNKKSLKPKYSDWIALYKCSSNRNLEEFVAVETDFINRSPTKHGFYPVTFLPNQLKSLKCNVDYEFLYGNTFNEICGVSRPVCFIHKNDCTFCYSNSSKTNHCVSQELVNSLFARISLVDCQLSDCKLQSSEIIAMNKRLMTQMNECEVRIEKNNQFLDNLFYTEEPVTKDGYRWMQQCTNTDLKMSMISRQECVLQDLSNQNASLKKVLEIFYKNNETKRSRGTQSNESYLLVNLDDKNYNNPSSNMDLDPLIDSMVNVESGFVPEPSIATIVFIDSEEDDGS